MALPIDIRERTAVLNTLHTLQKDRPALFGTMSPQHMIEHLVVTLRISNGREPALLAYTQEKADRIKSILYTNNEFPIGFRSPLLPPVGLCSLIYSDLKTAIDQFQSELESFDRYFQLNPEAMPVNPTMGELSYSEWIVFHNKHLTHHFKQFGL